MTDTPKEPNLQSEREALVAELLQLAMELAHVYSFVGDDSVRIAKDRLELRLCAALASRPIPAQAGEREALPDGCAFGEGDLGGCSGCEERNRAGCFFCDDRPLRERQALEQIAKIKFERGMDGDEAIERGLAAVGYARAALAGQASTQAPAEPPIAWWSGGEYGGGDEHGRLSLGTFTEHEDTWHDIPVYAGWNNEGEPSRAAPVGPTLRQSVYIWLGQWRDEIPQRAVSHLQDILGPLEGVLTVLAAAPAPVGVPPCK